jgi:hypothetical protein
MELTSSCCRTDSAKLKLETARMFSFKLMC